MLKKFWSGVIKALKSFEDTDDMFKDPGIQNHPEQKVGKPVLGPRIKGKVYQEGKQWKFYLEIHDGGPDPITLISEDEFLTEQAAKAMMKQTAVEVSEKIMKDVYNVDPGKAKYIDLKDMKCRDNLDDWKNPGFNKGEKHV